MDTKNNELMTLGHSIGADFIRDMIRICETNQDLIYVSTGLVSGMSAKLAAVVGPGIAVEVLEKVIEAIAAAIKPS